MKRFLKILLMLAATFTEVRVKARPLEEPRGCLQGNTACAVFADSRHERFKIQDADVCLLAGASMARKAPRSITAVKGAVLVRADSEWTLESLYLTAHARDGWVLLEARDEVVKLTNLTAEVRYRPRGYSSDLALPKGLMNEVGAVTTAGAAQTSYPRSMNLRPLMEAWSKCYQKAQFNEFKADFEEFLPHWRAGLDFVGPWYRETVERKLTEQAAERERQRRIREAREREANYYREMFRRKNFLD